MMKTPIFMVTAALTVAIIVTATFLVATGTRGDDAFGPQLSSPAKAKAGDPVFQRRRP
jgi:hypothetical protein